MFNINITGDPKSLPPGPQDEGSAVNKLVKRA